MGKFMRTTVIFESTVPPFLPRLATLVRRHQGLRRGNCAFWRPPLAKRRIHPTTASRMLIELKSNKNRPNICWPCRPWGPCRKRLQSGKINHPQLNCNNSIKNNACLFIEFWPKNPISVSFQKKALGLNKHLLHPYNYLMPHCRDRLQSGKNSTTQNVSFQQIQHIGDW